MPNELFIILFSRGMDSVLGCVVVRVFIITPSSEAGICHSVLMFYIYKFHNLDPDPKRLCARLMTTASRVLISSMFKNNTIKRPDKL